METKTPAEERLAKLQLDNNEEIDEIMTMLANVVCDIIYRDYAMGIGIEQMSPHLNSLTYIRETFRNLKSGD